MNASDVMVSAVVTVHSNASVQEVADLLLRNRISAVPVVDENSKLLGIVSEGDLINRPETQTKRGSWWLDAISSSEALAQKYLKSHSRKVADVMTRNVITALPTTPISEVAALLEKNGIKRVPIMEGEKIVGIVSRANLIQGLATLRERISSTPPDDSLIRENIMKNLSKERWARPSLLSVTVQDGAVDLWGIVESKTEKDAVRVVAEVTPGVRAVNDNLMIGEPFGYS